MERVAAWAFLNKLDRWCGCDVFFAFTVPGGGRVLDRGRVQPPAAPAFPGRAGLRGPGCPCGAPAGLAGRVPGGTRIGASGGTFAARRGASSGRCLAGGRRAVWRLPGRCQGAAPGCPGRGGPVGGLGRAANHLAGLVPARGGSQPRRARHRLLAGPLGRPPGPAGARPSRLQPGGTGVQPGHRPMPRLPAGLGPGIPTCGHLARATRGSFP